MKIDIKKMYAAMANACMDSTELQQTSGVPKGTMSNAFNRKSLRPSTVGKIARALNVPAEYLILDEEAERQQQEEKELDNKVKLIARYTELVRRLSEFSLMNQGNWKPEYNQEIAEIRAELAQLRVTLEMDR